MVPAALSLRHRYGDYRTWPDEPRCELLGGRILDMFPAPRRAHQAVVGEL